MRDLTGLRVQRGHRLRLPAFLRNANESSTTRGREHYVAVVGPISSAKQTGVGERHDISAHNRDLLEFPIGGETDPLPVAREEDLVGIVCARQSHGIDLTETPDVNLRLL